MANENTGTCRLQFVHAFEGLIADLAIADPLFAVIYNATARH